MMGSGSKKDTTLTSMVIDVENNGTDINSSVETVLIADNENILPETISIEFPNILKQESFPDENEDNITGVDMEFLDT